MLQSRTDLIDTSEKAQVPVPRLCRYRLNQETLLNL